MVLKKKLAVSIHRFITHKLSSTIPGRAKRCPGAASSHVTHALSLLIAFA
jgi:hypothetical protein